MRLSLVPGKHSFGEMLLNFMPTLMCINILYSNGESSFAWWPVLCGTMCCLHCSLHLRTLHRIHLPSQAWTRHPLAEGSGVWPRLVQMQLPCRTTSTTPVASWTVSRSRAVAGALTPTTCSPMLRSWWTHITRPMGAMTPTATSRAPAWSSPKTPATGAANTSPDGAQQVQAARWQGHQPRVHIILQAWATATLGGWYCRACATYFCTLVWHPCFLLCILTSS